MKAHLDVLISNGGPYSFAKNAQFGFSMLFIFLSMFFNVIVSSDKELFIKLKLKKKNKKYLNYGFLLWINNWWIHHFRRVAACGLVCKLFINFPLLHLKFILFLILNLLTMSHSISTIYHFLFPFLEISYKRAHIILEPPVHALVQYGLSLSLSLCITIIWMTT